MTQEEMWLLKEKYGGEKTEGFFADCARLSHGEPLAYIIGHIPFLDTTINLDNHPLIPRPETEFWVGEALREIRTRSIASGTVSVLDLCAGSGCIGVAVLKAIREARVDFVEIDPCLHVTIEKNIIENGIDSHRTAVFGGNLFEQITQTYDYILSNPPYIDPTSTRVETSVRAHEPHRALFGGTNGIELIAHIISHAPRHLSPQGILFIEHEPEQMTLIHTYAKKHGLNAHTYRDQYGTDRYTHLSRTIPERVAS